MLDPRALILLRALSRMRRSVLDGGRAADDHSIVQRARYARRRPRPESPRAARRAKLVSMTSLNDDPACDVAHGAAPALAPGRVLVAVFASPVADLLLRYGRDAGYRPVLVEPGPERAEPPPDPPPTLDAPLPHPPPPPAPTAA